MKRLTIYLLVATICFFVSLSAYQLWPAPSPKIDRPLPLSICELVSEPERYNGKVVMVKGVLHGDLGGNPQIVDESCGLPPSSRAISVSVEADQVLSILPGWASYASFC